jgi:plasmid stability protein
MTVSLSIKNVPDDLARRLRARAARNRRSLQRELMLILEQAAAPCHAPASGEAGNESAAERMSFDEIFARARILFPRGTSSSVATIRRMRDERAREPERRAASQPPRRSR